MLACFTPQSVLSPGYWAAAARTAQELCHLLNDLGKAQQATRATQQVTPWECWTAPGGVATAQPIRDCPAPLHAARLLGNQKRKDDGGAIQQRQNIIPGGHRTHLLHTASLSGAAGCQTPPGALPQDTPHKLDPEQKFRLFFNMRPPSFEVIKFFPDGHAEDYSHPQTAEALGVHPRDMTLFTHNNKFAPQRATIVERDGVVLFKTEVAKAVISCDQVILIKSRKVKDNERMRERLLHTLQSPPGNLPFELVVLEALLYETVEFFYRKVQNITWMMDHITLDLKVDRRPFPAMDRAQHLIPLQKFLTAIRNDVSETAAALSEVLEDDEALMALCLTERKRRSLAEINAILEGSDVVGIEANLPAGGGDPHMKLASQVLEAYEREIKSIEGSLKELEENLENSREVWHMQLDSARNHIILVNLWLSVINISVMSTTIIPAFFGMNVTSGVPDTPTAFYLLCGGSLLLALASFPLARHLYYRHWAKQTQRELGDIKTLRLVLSQHMDDLTDIIAAISAYPGTMDRATFQQAIQQALYPRSMSRANIDYLFHCFDINRDGFLSVAEKLSEMGSRLATEEGRTNGSREGGGRRNGTKPRVRYWPSSNSPWDDDPTAPTS